MKKYKRKLNKPPRRVKPAKPVKYKKGLAFCVLYCIRVFKMFFLFPQGCCKFYPSCSEFTKEAIEKLPLHTAFLLIAKRIFSCHPFAPGGYDPVPEKNVTKG